MKYAAVFLIAGVLLPALAIVTGGISWILVWPGLNLLVLSAAYGFDRPALHGKSPDGRLNPAVVIGMLPYFALTWIAWHVFRRVTPEPVANEVAPGLWVGRRPYARDVPEGALVVDLTAEFTVDPAVRSAHSLVFLPTLDARAPHLGPLREALVRIEAHDGPVYIHCAAGHGRSATAAAAVLITRGEAKDPESAEKLMRQARPNIHLHSVQKRRLRELM